MRTARQAMEHTRRFRPVAFSRIANPEQHFERLWRELEDQAEEVASLTARSPEEFIRIANMEQTRLVHELMLIPDETDEPPEGAA